MDDKTVKADLMVVQLDRARTALAEAKTIGETKKVLDGLDFKSRSPFIDVEIFVEAAKRGFIIRQYGLIFELRTNGVSSISRMSVVARTFRDMLVYKFSK